MDPLEYFSRFLDLSETILNHLSGEDIIKISEVSPSFYNFIASSNVLMKKIKIVFKVDRVMHPEDYDLLENSSRMYQNIELSYRLSEKTKNLDMEYQTIELLPHKYKGITIVDAKFPDKEYAWNFFSWYQSTVECISLDNVFVSYDETSSEPTIEVFTFPKLKQLKLIHKERDSGYPREFFKNSVAVEKFEYRFDGNIDDDKELTMEMLKSFDKLQSLTLYERNMNEIFEDESCREFNFKLKNLAIISANSLICEETALQNFVNFLRMQSDNLEELTMELYNDKEIINIIMKMSKLKRLSLKHFVYGYLNKTKRQNIDLLEKSSTITELILKGDFQTENIKLLLKIMPKVQRLSIVSINQETIQEIIEMKRKFEEIKIHDFRGIDREQLANISDKVSSFPFKCCEEICDCLKSNDA